MIEDKINYSKDFIKWFIKDIAKKFNKITKVTNQKGTTSFRYDKKGNLKKAVSNNGKAVLLFYDHKGRITKMIDKSGKKSKKRIHQT